MNYKTKYPHIAAAGFTLDDIASYFGYKTTSAFRTSTKYHKMLAGIDMIISLCETKTQELNKRNILQTLEYVDELRNKVMTLDA
jgi:hypothetical protein